ncbi:multicomponent Na+:H+ antiporter subunit B [Alkalihalobacillus xiaoxiensis]|uniref:Multicomponent Na+:H+ antiporter subunit B n=1 Tax=Shouchella xiaoxiensis TaxID=766895 RepID=A0ABS2SS24_9BACI|nr:multicomponent Na+:H+ antiporter subunit B [Shouchella xiaoxiensis]
MKFSRSHDVMQRVLITITIYFLVAFSFYLFFAGHNNPGGGFIGGLMTASAFILIYLIFDRQVANRIIRFSFPGILATGLLISIAIGLIGPLIGDEMFSQYFDYFDLPFFGEVELTTAVPFDFGIYLVVVGMAMAATVTIAEDENEWKS